MEYVQPIGDDPDDPYIDANPGTGTEGSAVPAAALEHPMREIVQVIDDAGLVPDGGDLTQLSAAISALIAAGADSAFGSELLHLRDEKASGTDGGDFTSGAWQKRTLNTVNVNEITGASLASSVITLPAGQYRGWCRCPAHEVGLNQARLRDTTNTVTVAVGASHRTLDSTNISHDAVVWFDFTLAGSADIELQHRCDGGETVTGFGAAVSFGEVEVYAEAMIWKVS